MLLRQVLERVEERLPFGPLEKPPAPCLCTERWPPRRHSELVRLLHDDRDGLFLRMRPEYHNVSQVVIAPEEDRRFEELPDVHRHLPQVALHEVDHAFHGPRKPLRGHPGLDEDPGMAIPDLLEDIEDRPEVETTLRQDQGKRASGHYFLLWSQSSGAPQALDAACLRLRAAPCLSAETSRSRCLDSSGESRSVLEPETESASLFTFRRISEASFFVFPSGAISFSHSLFASAFRRWKSVPPRSCSSASSAARASSCLSLDERAPALKQRRSGPTFFMSFRFIFISIPPQFRVGRHLSSGSPNTISLCGFDGMAFTSSVIAFASPSTRSRSSTVISAARTG